MRDEGESNANYFNRLWSALDDTAAFTLSDSERGEASPRKLSITDRVVWPGHLYDDISEFLHGRGPLAAAVRFEVCDLLRPTYDAATLAAGQKILDLLELCTERIATCVAALLSEQGDRRVAGENYSLARAAHPAGGAPYPRWGLWPLVPNTGLSPAVVTQFRAARQLLAKVHRGEHPAGRRFINEEISAMFFMACRGRSADFALTAFKKEDEAVGHLWDPNVLSGREFYLICTAEVLGLIGNWEDCPGAATAASMASSGLRSAFWLWLEDDDRAMGMLRVVLEALARLETHNRKPDKAAKLDDRGNLTTPRDWLEAAGWRRLHALNVALGELAHTRENSRWVGARELLVALQPVDEDPELAPHRGRGYALDSIVAMAARTALGSIERLSPALRASLYGLMSNTSLFNERTDKELNGWLDRTWATRSFDLGETIFNTGLAANRGTEPPCAVPIAEDG